jgi:hypothetical protein
MEGVVIIVKFLWIGMGFALLLCIGKVFSDVLKEDGK